MDEAPGNVVAWLKHDQSAEDHQRRGDSARARRSIASAIGTHTPAGHCPPPGIPPTWLDPLYSPRLGCADREELSADDQLPPLAQDDLDAPGLERRHDRMDPHRKHRRDTRLRAVDRGHDIPQPALACHAAALPKGSRPERRFRQAPLGAAPSNQPPPDTPGLGAPASCALRPNPAPHGPRGRGGV